MLPFQVCGQPNRVRIAVVVVLLQGSMGREAGRGWRGITLEDVKETPGTMVDHQLELVINLSWSVDVSRKVSP